MKILLISSLWPLDYVIPQLDLSGIPPEEITLDLQRISSTSSLYNISKLWIKKNHEVLFMRTAPNSINFRKKNKVMQRLRKHNEIITLDSIKTINLPIIRIPIIEVYIYHQIYKILKRQNYNPDVVIAHTHDSYLWAHRVAKRYRVPYIIGIHGYDIKFVQKIKNKCLSFILWRQMKLVKRSDLVAFRSVSIYKHFINLVPSFNHKYFIAFSGIEKRLIQPVDVFINKIKSWKSSNNISFITVGSHIPLKNIDLVINVLSTLEDEVEWSYTLVGEGRETANLKLLCKDLGIENKVIFKGHLNRKMVIDELRKADIFILVSAPETFGLSYLEAMASGCIVIGAKGWGIDGIVKDGVNGFLCDPGNEQMLSSKLETILLMSEEKLQQISMRCRQTICEYTEEKASKNYIDHIDKCVTHRSTITS